MNYKSHLLLLAVLPLAFVAACSQPAPSGPASESGTPTSLSTTASPVDTPTPSPSNPPTDEEPPSRTPVPPVSGTRTLTLADAFDPGSWKEGSYTPTNQSAMQAIGVDVGCHSDHLVEYRFSRASGQLLVSVAQDSLSASSDITLEWSLIADGRQVESKTIAFKETAELKTDLSGVAVVKIAVKQKDSSRCQGAATALVTRILITA